MRKTRTRKKNEYVLADAVMRAALSGIMAFLCCFSSVWMAQDVFPKWVLSERALRWLCAVIIFTVLLYELVIRALPRVLQFFCRLLVPAGYAAAVVRYGRARQIDLEDGACALGTEFFIKFNKHLKTSVSIWRGKPQYAGMAFAFGVLVALLVLLLLSLQLLRKGILLLLPLAVFATELLIGYVPEWKGLALFFAALLLACADGSGGKTARLTVRADRRRRNGSVWYLSWIPIVCLALTGVLLLFGGSLLTTATKSRMMAAAPNVQAFQRQAEKHVSDIWRGYFAPRQEMVNNRTPRYTGREMLRVTASRRPAEDMLLKGFCGTDYENGGWYCDKQKFSDICEGLGYAEHEAARELLQAQYDLYTQDAQRILMRYSFGGNFFSMNVSENAKAEYTIEHTGVKSRYLFAPYAVSHDTDPDQERLVSDVVIHKSWRKKTFSYSGWDHFTGGIDISGAMQKNGKSVFDWYEKFANKAYLRTSDQVASLTDYLTAMQRTKGIDREESNRSLAWDRDMAADRNWLTLLYLQQETAYIDDPLWKNQNRLQKALIVAATLKQYQSYSMDLDPLPDGEDAVNYFLMHSGRGYCVHFASAAVLLLRELGVPARYASGYVVRTGEFRKTGNQYVASVKDRNAHAWAEIYLEETGWIPIDVTPGAAASANAAGFGQEQEHPDTADPQRPEDTNTGDTQTDTDDTQTDADDGQKDTDPQKQESGQRQDKRIKPWIQRYSLLWILAIAGIVIFIAAVIVRQILRCYFRIPLREIRAGNYRQAVRRINWRIYCRLCARGKMTRTHLTDDAYGRMLKNVYQQIRVEDWSRYLQIVQQAAFARDEVSPEDAAFCWYIYQEILGKWRVFTADK